MISDDKIKKLYEVVCDVVNDQLTDLKCDDDYEDFLIDDIIDFILGGTPTRIKRLYGIEVQQDFELLRKITRV